MSDCLFCGIAQGLIPATTVLETPEVMAFRDIDPKAPAHVLVIPRLHVDNLTSLANHHPELLTHVLRAAADVAVLEGLEGGYRVVSNIGEDGGQTVGHMHLHVLGGRSMTWPPG
jgi:histidine triad (HIT) family protein